MRRYVRPGHDTDVWVASGRWGPRRVRVTECWAVLKAEDVYTSLLRDDPNQARPGARGSVEWRLPGRSLSVAWELRENAVWRFGRLFLECPKCSRRATRIYVPSDNAWPACRRCWGLTYESRQQWNYNTGSSLLSLNFGPVAYWYTYDERRKRAEASEERYAERREILKRTGQ
jgi:hypothetical protein